MAAVEYVGDVVDPLGPDGGVPGGGPQVDVPEPRGDLVDGDTGLEAVGGPVGAQRVRVREPTGHAGGLAVAADEPVDGLVGEGEGWLAAVAAETDEQRLLVAQPDAVGERVDAQPRLERVLDGFGDGDLALAATLAADEQPVVPGVRTWATEVLSAEASQLGGAQSAVAQ